MPKVYFKDDDGRMYTWRGWHGCQLESIEWRRVPAGTERTILGYKMRVFRTERKGLKIATTWTIPLDCDLNESNRRIREFKADLQKLI